MVYSSQQEYTHLVFANYTKPVLGAGMQNRIRELRNQAGLTQAQLADRVGTSQAQINRLEASTRRLSDFWMIKIAQAFAVEPTDLFEKSDAKKVPVIGYVGAGAQVFSVDDMPIIRTVKEARDVTHKWRDDAFDGTDPVEYVDTPPGQEGKGLLALKIRGDSWEPYINEGEYIYYCERGCDPTEMLNKKCVIQVKDGPILFKVLKRGSEYGRYRLQSPNAPEMEDVEIEWCAKVTAIIPG